jgi:hypothetical protein
MDVALARFGKDLGDAVLACLDDPAFRLELEQISTERLAAAEHKLVDLLLRRLDGPDEGVEKAALSLWQLLRDDRRRTSAPAAGPKPLAPKAQRASPSERQAAGQRAATRAEDFNQLLEVVRARLAAAEERKAAGKGVDGPDAGQGSSISSSRTRS